MQRPKMIDPRQPRVGQAITGLVLAIGFVGSWPQALPAIAAVLALSLMLPPRFNPYVAAYRGVRRVAGWGPSGELEEAAPPRFANGLGLAFTASASILYFGFGLHTAAWVLGVLVAALALLAASTGLCVGCEFYVFARRLAGTRRSRVEARA
jgi:hypothetical protein